MRPSGGDLADAFRDDTFMLANVIGRDLSAPLRTPGTTFALEPQVRRTAPGVRPRRVRGSLVSGSGRARGQEPKGTVVDVLMAIRTAWRSLPARHPVAAPARAPEAPIERLIADTLAARGPLPGACRARSLPRSPRRLGRMLWAAAGLSPTCPARSTPPAASSWVLETAA